MNTPRLRHELRMAADVLAKNRKVCAQARDTGDDVHAYNADRLEELSEACLAGAVQEYLRAVSGAIVVRELGKL
jgi:uncharacterized protein YbbK (DUF523 family)